MDRNTIFLLDRMPWEDRWTIRICLPGIVNDKHAVYLEETYEGTYEEAKALIDKILERLPLVVKAPEEKE